MPKFTTLEAHIGDRPHDPYLPGETREVDDANTVKHLTEGASPVLGEFDAKAEAAFEKALKEKAGRGADKNKAEGAADKNKAEGAADKNKAA